MHISARTIGEQAALSRLAECVERLNQWMGQNRLKLNADKIHLIWLGTRQQLAKLTIQTDETHQSGLKILMFPVTRPTLVFYPNPNFFMDLANLNMQAKWVWGSLSEVLWQITKLGLTVIVIFTARRHSLLC